MITIDPNLRGCGVAVWFRGNLVSANYVKSKNESRGRGYKIYKDLAASVTSDLHSVNSELAQMARGRVLGDPLIIELPRFYGSTHEKGDPNDLIDVCGVGAACATAIATQHTQWGSTCNVEHVFPSEWKGNVKKSIMLERIWSKLSDAEKAVVQKTNKSDTEDILDSVGIGLFKLGRLNKRVIHNG